VKNIWLLFLKDFRRKWKNPAVIIGFMLIPVVFTFLFGMIFGSSDEEFLPQANMLAADNDESFVSQFFLAAFTQGELNKLIKIKKVQEEEGRKLMDRGKASALLIIPENFGDDIWKGRIAEILLLKNPSEQFLPQIVEEVTDTASLLLSALLSIFSKEVDVVRGFSEKGEIPNVEISTLSVQVKDRIDSISKYVFPPVISIKEQTIQEDEKEEQSTLTVYSYILPAMSIMFLLFICNIVFEDLLREKEKGTLLRMLVSPMQLSEFIWSKILASAVIGMLCTLVLIGVGFGVFSIKWGHPILVFLIIFSLNILIAGFISVLYSFVRTERQAGALITSVILIMSLLGGSMIPVENFPGFIQTFSKLTVNYWGLKVFQKAIVEDPVTEIFPILAGMILAGMLLSFICTYFLNKSLRKGLTK
jgi:ABC-2 type transport system permease protein